VLPALLMAVLLVFSNQLLFMMRKSIPISLFFGSAVAHFNLRSIIVDGTTLVFVNDELKTIVTLL
jgi:hypothetical protein